jgi:hypothetical protein
MSHRTPVNRKKLTWPIVLVVAAALSGAWSEVYGGLIINPTFDSTITSDPNAAAIEGVINQAIGNYETYFSNPITVTIDFEEMTTGLGHSNWWYYTMSYQTFYNYFKAGATTADATTALAHLPSGTTNPVTGSTSIELKTANIRALGIPGSFPSGLSGGYDGIIGLNTHITDIGSPGSSGQYSLISTTEHEIDEILGLASALDGSLSNPLPEDLYRYTSTGARTYTTTGDNAYFSLDGTTDLARFNQDSAGDHGDWWSNNGAGNPGPNPPTQVQDAFLYPGTHPVLGVELRALNVIGYTPTPTPEPSTSVLLVTAVVAIVLGRVAYSRLSVVSPRG